MHYWIAYVLLAVVALHVMLHGKWIVAVIRGKPTDASPYRLFVGAAAVLFLTALTALPFLSSTERVTRQELRDRNSTTPGDGSRADLSPDPARRDADESNIRGSMTLGEIALAVHHPLEAILSAAELPPATDPGERAGRLLHLHGKTMTDLREAIGKLAGRGDN